MADTRVQTDPDEVIVDYLKDIRDQLAALNKKLDNLTISDISGPDMDGLRTYDTNG